MTLVARKTRERSTTVLLSREGEIGKVVCQYLNLRSAYIDCALGLGGLWDALALLGEAGSLADIAGVLGVGIGELLLLARLGVEVTSSLGRGSLGTS